MAYIKREIEEKVLNWLDEREIIAIRGPRQSGKTTILKRIKETLEQKGINKERIVYLSFEDDLPRMKFEEDCKEFIESYTSAEKTYFLIDEVQYVKDIGKKLKLVFDLVPNIKLVITGSSSFDLTNLGKFLVGRVVFFDLYPFSFQEFLRAKGERYEKEYSKIKVDFNKVDIKKTLFLDELNKLLHEYLTYGSYPRIVLEQDKSKKIELLKNMFTTYVEKDVVSLYGNKYRDSSVKLLKALSSILGGVIKYETLSEASGLKYNEVTKILPLLQDSFTIFIVKPFHKNVINELKKNPKIYFVDSGIRNYLLGNFENLSFESLYENFVYSELHKQLDVKYWRTASKTEVDFVIENREVMPIEVKTTPKITRSLISFIKNYKPKIAFIASPNIGSNREIEGCIIYSIPLAYF
jgi:hypothetical protein